MMPSTIIDSPPASDEYNEYYHQYISKFTPNDFLADFEAQIGELHSVLGSLSDAEVSCLHEPYTWTLKQVVGHLIDVERIFSTRALRIGVGDATPIPGIDHDIYVANLDYDKVTMKELLQEFECLRKSNVALARRMDETCLQRIGEASGNPVSAKANLYILAGHVVYHMEIVKQRLASK